MIFKSKSLNTLAGPDYVPEAVLLAAVLAQAARDALKAKRLAVPTRRKMNRDMRYKRRMLFDAIDFLHDPEAHELANALGVDLAGWMKEKGI